MTDKDSFPKFKIGDYVTKTSGSSWTGYVVGTYKTALTPEGYAVESETEAGSVQIYPAKALIATSKELPNDLSDAAVDVLLQALEAFDSCGEFEDERTGNNWHYVDFKKVIEASDAIRTILKTNGYVL